MRGIERFLVSPPHESELAGGGPAGEVLFAGRSRWVALLTEVLPRALLAELGLPKILLGASGGGRFLVVLPDASCPRAEEFLNAAAEGVRKLSGGFVSLIWAVTENLGDWSVVRKRLTEQAAAKIDTPASGAGEDFFRPFDPPGPADTGGYFSELMGLRLREARRVGWSPEAPARILPDEGAYTWPLEGSSEAIPLARHAAPDEEGNTAATPAVFAARAQGRKAWGVLRGDVDNFRFRVRRLQTIEEYVQLSVLFKQFFAGELQVLCSMPEFWRKVTILYAGGNDFAVFGSWDALVVFARQVQRLFHRFNEESLKEIPGAEGKTISMALALAPEVDTPLAEVYRDAGRKLEIAKSTDKDSFYLFGHTVEWRQLARAAELQDSLGRLVREFGGSPELLGDLIRFYKAGDAGAGEPEPPRFRRPWRYHRRLSLVAEGARDREYQKLRSKLVSELIGKGAAPARLRPAGRVALEWAKLMAEV